MVWFQLRFRSAHLHSNAEELRRAPLYFSRAVIKGANTCRGFAGGSKYSEFVGATTLWCPGRWASSAGSQVAQQRAEWPLCFVIS